MSPIRILTPAKWITARTKEEAMPRNAIWWIKNAEGQEVGPFLNEPDARLAKSALAFFREDLQWEVFRHVGPRE